MQHEVDAPRPRKRRGMFRPQSPLHLGVIEKPFVCHVLGNVQLVHEEAIVRGKHRVRSVVISPAIRPLQTILRQQVRVLCKLCSNKFEIVHFSYDSDQKSMEAYMKKSHMAFPAVAKADLKKVGALAKTGETGFIPNAVLVKPDGKLVTNDLDKLIQTLRSLK